MSKKGGLGCTPFQKVTIFFLGEFKELLSNQHRVVNFYTSRPVKLLKGIENSENHEIELNDLSCFFCFTVARKGLINGFHSK